MEWTDNGIILSARPHGETASLVTLLTAEHGRHAGLVFGGQSRRNAALLQAGNHVAAHWRARLSDHLGNLSLEMLSATAAPWLNDPEILALIASATSIVEAALPERQPMKNVYDGLGALFSIQDRRLWAPAYVKWEMEVLKALGYGIDLTCCALTGVREGLAFISPRTGRAACAIAAEPFRHKLLPLPSFLCGAAHWDDAAVLQGLELTGHFMARHVFAHAQGPRFVALPSGGALPHPRARLERFYRQKRERVVKVA